MKSENLEISFQKLQRVVKGGSGVRGRGEVSVPSVLCLSTQGKKTSFLVDVFSVCLNPPLLLGNKIE